VPDFQPRSVAGGIVVSDTFMRQDRKVGIRTIKERINSDEIWYKLSVFSSAAAARAGRATRCVSTSHCQRCLQKTAASKRVCVTNHVYSVVAGLLVS
jgi:hypothetical protein